MPRSTASPLSSARSPRSEPTRRPRRSRPPVPSAPLGSLTQPGMPGTALCDSCGSAQVTRLSMRLTDGTPVSFTSCHRCEARSWEHEGAPLSVQSVLEHTRKLA